MFGFYFAAFALVLFFALLAAVEIVSVLRHRPWTRKERWKRYRIS